MKRTQQDIEMLNNLFLSADEGKTIEFNDEKSAINMRQKLYSHKRNVKSAGDDEKMLDIANRLMVQVDGTTVHITTRLDYMSELQGQIDAS